MDQHRGTYKANDMCMPAQKRNVHIMKLVEGEGNAYASSGKAVWRAKLQHSPHCGECPARASTKACGEWLDVTAGCMQHMPQVLTCA